MSTLNRAERRNAVLKFVHERVAAVSPGEHLMWMFLGRHVCRLAFVLLTGVSDTVLQAARRQVAAGEVRYMHPGFQRASPIMEQMRGAIWALIDQLHERMPLKDENPDALHMPFHHKIFLFRLLQQWYYRRQAEGASPLLQAPPKKPTFFAILQEPEFALVRFHRVVEMGRCPVCCVLQRLVFKLGRKRSYFEQVEW